MYDQQGPRLNQSISAFIRQDTLSFIDSLHEYYSTLKSSTSSKNTLIFFQTYRDVADGVVSALEELDSKADWDVILVCPPRFCLLSQRIGINKIIPEIEGTRELMDIIRNPNFNRFEYLKHVKLHDNRLRKCLEHKSIHIVIINGPDVPLKMLENIALLLYNTEDVAGTKINLHVRSQSFVSTFWKHFIEKSGLYDYKNFAFNADSMYRGFFGSLKEPGSNDSYLVFDLAPEMETFICNIMAGDRKSFVFFTTLPKGMKSCVDRFERSETRHVDAGDNFLGMIDIEVINKLYRQIYENLIEEILNVSCLS